MALSDDGSEKKTHHGYHLILTIMDPFPPSFKSFFSWQSQWWKSLSVFDAMQYEKLEVLKSTSSLLRDYSKIYWRIYNNLQLRKGDSCLRWKYGALNHIHWTTSTSIPSNSRIRYHKNHMWTVCSIAIRFCILPIQRSIELSFEWTIRPHMPLPFSGTFVHFWYEKSSIAGKLKDMKFHNRI